MSNNWKELPPTDREFASHLINWFNDNGRDYPWRNSRNPYHTLCVEQMLQRTRADQVAPVYVDFCSRYSSPQNLISTGRKTVDELFNKLGLKWRSKHFWALQKELVQRFGGAVPKEEELLLSLPGVGPYVSTAVRIFAFGDIATVVDSNVLRVFGRFYGIEFPDHARRSRHVLEWATAHAPNGSNLNQQFNWALIDLGALVCKPQKPECDNCSLLDNCWFANNLDADEVSQT